MGADDLAKQGAKASATLIFASLYRDNSVSGMLRVKFIGT